MIDSESITPFELLHAYSRGLFPMAMGRQDDELYWFSPEMRGVLPLDGNFNTPRSLRKLLKEPPFTVTFDTAFHEVITACANTRSDTWINDEIIDLYTQLHHMGHAHSVECWLNHSTDNANESRQLVGGLYGISLASAFFGESMFSHASGASKVALYHLVEHLKTQQYTLLDTQYVNDHLRQFGVQEIPRDDYLKLLKEALSHPAYFSPPTEPVTGPVD